MLASLSLCKPSFPTILQVRDGIKLSDSIGQHIAACCPMGVFIEQEDQLCGCVDNKLESPYRLVAYHPTTDPGTGSVTFSMDVNTVGAKHDSTDTTFDCTQSDLDSIRIYIDPSYVQRARGWLSRGSMVGGELQAGSGVTCTYANPMCAP